MGQGESGRSFHHRPCWSLIDQCGRRSCLLEWIYIESSVSSNEWWSMWHTDVVPYLVINQTTGDGARGSRLIRMSPRIGSIGIKWTSVLKMIASTFSACMIVFQQKALLWNWNSVEDQASAARLVLKQAHASWRQAQGCGSILATRTDPEASKQYSDSFPPNLIQITTGYEPNCCLCYAGTRKENSSRN